MGIIFGVMAIVAGFTHWSWLAVAGGVLAIATDALGFMSGALHGCMPTIVSWLLGALIGGAILGAMGLSGAASMLGGIALAAMVGDAIGLIMGAMVSR